MKIITKSVTYVDVDECTGTNNCNSNAKCTNTYGSHFCTCNSGKIFSKQLEVLLLALEAYAREDIVLINAT